METPDKVYARISSARARIQHLKYLASSISDGEARKALRRVIADREDRLFSMEAERCLVALANSEIRRDPYSSPAVWLAEYKRVEGEYKKIVEARR